MISRKPGLFVSDLDGTLLPRGGDFSRQLWPPFEAMGDRGIVRVIATGRTQKSALEIVPSDFPLDYLIYSSGVGVVRWSDKAHLVQCNLDGALVDSVQEQLSRQKLDFMVLFPAPENHRFYYSLDPSDKTDFKVRLDRYREFGLPLEERSGGEPASQFLIFCPPGAGEKLYGELAGQLKHCHVTRCLSPLDGESVWVEVSAEQASKSGGARWVYRHAQITGETCAFGNDLNDLDLLEWADVGFVVSQASPFLLERFTVVGSCEAFGIEEVVGRWLGPVE